MAHSYEPSRRGAYSDNLRWRMVWQREALGFTYDQIAANLGVDKSTVQRTVQLFLNTGSVCKRPYPKEKAFRKLTQPAQLFILRLVVDNPGMYLDEIQRQLKTMLMLEVSLSTICRFLHDNGFTRKKLQKVALQQDKFLREQYISDVSVYSRDMIVFVDETGADKRNTLRKYGYSLRGKTPRSHELLVRGERVSAIACMSCTGLLDVKTVRGTANGDTFYDFVQTHLLPNLMPFDGRNPHSVVVMDNCSIHHVQEVVTSIQDVGALVHFLAPYSPDFNPIEELFAKVKAELKAREPQMQHITDLHVLLLAAFNTVTPEDCNGWVNHCGIYF